MRFSLFIFIFLENVNWHFFVFPMGSVHCSRNSQTFFFNKTFIKNKSYGTIHTFKNYFTTIFSVFNFQQNKWYLKTPLIPPTKAWSVFKWNHIKHQQNPPKKATCKPAHTLIHSKFQTHSNPNNIIKRQTQYSSTFNQTPKAINFTKHIRVLDH